jgi:hypothetical protein
MQSIIASLTLLDWPAWVQAVGSVAAIAAAVWLSRRQNLADRKALESAQDASVVVFAFALRSLCDICEELNEIYGYGPQHVEIAAPRIMILKDAADIHHKLIRDFPIYNLRDPNDVDWILFTQQGSLCFKADTFLDHDTKQQDDIKKYLKRTSGALESHLGK